MSTASDAFGGAHPQTRLWRYAAGHRRRMVRTALCTTLQKFADRVPARGRVAESGTHEELVAAGGLYTALWRVQTGEPVASPLP